MNAEEAKVWLYRAQQRLAITRSEAAALLALAALLLAGVAARYVQGRPQAAPGSTFAATDHRFQEGAARLQRAAAGAAAGPAATSDTATGHAATESAAVGNAAAGDAQAPAPSTAQKMNLNDASEARLEKLPGVGPVIAGRIAAYRQAHGAFAEVEHLERVSGIGPKTLERLAPLVSVAAAPADTLGSGGAPAGQGRP